MPLVYADAVNLATISAVIPTHNRPEALARAVESVAGQTTAVDEIVIVDDGSMPPVDSTCFTETRSSVIVVRNESPLGAAGARNIGVATASGKFISFLDDDDTWDPVKMELVSECLRQHTSADIVIHRTAYQAVATRQALDCSQVTDPLLRMIRHQPPHLDGVTVRRTLHLEHPFNESMQAAEDLDYLITLARTDATMIESDAVLAIFGEDEPSVIGSDTRIAGRLSLLDRHPEIGEDPQALAFFYVRLGHLQRRGGRRPDAIKSFVRALRTQPVSAQPWKGLARSLIGR
jgi:glycosyltransferase involved in cell wall biosynthesis